ncbi:extracellular solute-binding protein [Paenibacillus senegalensis]|uniref:extracellular solute-binding protein n=1 Tax=Paenibacillus senegalensis TaxID=1465766 RepID=UPI000289287B|nr:extracellular solute-binding protein [Paenibacillus senegalensis]
MRNKKAIALPSAILLLSAVFAGCASSNGTGDTETPSPSASPSQSTDQVTKLEVMLSASGLPSPDKDFVKQELDKALNIDLVMSAYGSADDYQNQLNVRMASGNLPDLFGVNKAQIQQYQKQNLLLDLTPYLESDLQEVVNFIGEDTVKKGMIDGKVYAIPKAPGIPSMTIWIRKDWLDNLNLEVPKTLDEFFEVARAFTEDDPDQNGVNDTIGYTGGSLSTFAPLYGSFGTVNPGEFFVKDGEIINSLYDPAMKEALTFFNEMMSAGVVDPEIMANSGLLHQEKAIKGQAGMLFIDWANISKDEIVEQIHTVNPNAEWIQLATPEGPGGAYANSWDIGNAGAMFAIPKSLENDPDKLSKVFELLNYVSSEEGSMLVQFGLEGRHYNIEDGQVVATELMGQEAGFTWLYQFTGRPEMEYLQVKFARQAEYIEFASNHPRLEVLNGFVDFPEGYNPADANRYLEEEFTKFIYGTRPLSEYDDFLNTMDTTMNYKLYVDSAIEQLKALGYGN